jgi:hypothetical protein
MFLAERALRSSSTVAFMASSATINISQNNYSLCVYTPFLQQFCPKIATSLAL